MSVNNIYVPPGSEVYKIAVVGPQGTTTVEVRGQDVNKTEPASAECDRQKSEPVEQVLKQSMKETYGKYSLLSPQKSESEKCTTGGADHSPSIVGGDYADWFDIAAQRLRTIDALWEENQHAYRDYLYRIDELKKSHHLEKGKLYGRIAGLQAQVNQARHVLQSIDNTGTSAPNSEQAVNTVQDAVKSAYRQFQ